MKVESINVMGHYDIHLSGWLRAGGQYLYFDIVDDEADDPVYNVFEITDRSARLEALRKLQSWRHEIGWHWFRYGGTKRGEPGSSRHGGLKPGYMENLRKRDGNWSLELVEAFRAAKKLVGKTRYPFSEIEMSS